MIGDKLIIKEKHRRAAEQIVPAVVVRSSTITASCPSTSPTSVYASTVSAPVRCLATTARSSL